MNEAKDVTLRLPSRARKVIIAERYHRGQMRPFLSPVTYRFWEVTLTRDALRRHVRQTIKEES